MTEPATRLPCGCILGSAPLPDGTSAFVYTPCSEDCEYYLYMQKAAAEQNKPVHTMDFRGESVEIGGHCPVCGAAIGMARDMAGAGATPSPGDWSLCSECAAILRFDDNLVMRVATEAELAEAPAQLNVVQSRLLERRR